MFILSDLLDAALLAQEDTKGFIFMNQVCPALQSERAKCFFGNSPCAPVVHLDTRWDQNNLSFVCKGL